MLILASASSTRKALLDKALIACRAVPAAIDERGIETAAVAAGADARDIAVLLARKKAEAVSASHPGALVIGADQTLSVGHALLHKPLDRVAAARQLTSLSGRTHRLHAGVALVRDGQLLWSTIDTASLTMRDFSADERDSVLDLEGDEVLGSVGSYRLEGPSIRLFEAISGDYFTILGLPLLPLLAALRDIAPDLLASGNRPS